MSDTEMEESSVPGAEMNNLADAQNIDLQTSLAEALNVVARQSEMMQQLFQRLDVSANNNSSTIDIRKDKISKLYSCMQKSQKIKSYSENSGEPIKKWLERFHIELYTEADMKCNLELNSEPLSRYEYVQII